MVYWPLRIDVAHDTAIPSSFQECCGSLDAKLLSSISSAVYLVEDERRPVKLLTAASKTGPYWKGVTQRSKLILISRSGHQGETGKSRVVILSRSKPLRETSQSIIYGKLPLKDDSWRYSSGTAIEHNLGR